MDLSTMLQLVDSRTTAFYYAEVKGLFRQMFANRHRYNEPNSEICQKAKIFE